MSISLEARERRKKKFLERRTKVWDEVMKEYPEGLTKDNLRAIQQKVKTKERIIKKQERGDD